MTKIIFLIIAIVVLCVTTDHCQASHHADSTEKRTEIIPSKSDQSFSYHGRYHRRIRRQYDQAPADPDIASTVLSILPLDTIGTIVGQMLSTGLKDMFNPDVGKKLVNVLENQAPSLLTSLFANLFSTLRAPAPVRPATTNNTILSVLTNNNVVKQLSNGSIAEVMNDIRRPARK